MFLNGEWVELKVVAHAYHRSANGFGPESNDLAIYQLATGLTAEAWLSIAPAVPSAQARCHILGFLPKGKQTDVVALQRLECLMGYEGSKSPMEANNLVFLHGQAASLNSGNLKGMSGGPIVNGAEEVVGMFISGDYKREPRNPPPNYRPAVDFDLTAVSGLHIANVIRELAQ